MMKPPDGLNITNLVPDALGDTNPDASDEDAAATTEIWLGAVLTGTVMVDGNLRRNATSRILSDVKRALEHERALQRLAARTTLGAEALLELLEANFDSAVVPERSSRRFSASEEAALEEAGVDLSGPPEATYSPDSRTLSRLLALHSHSLTVADAAARLDRTTSRVRQRLMERTLYAFRAPGGEWRIPDWQFTDAGPIPGLETVAPELPIGLHPLSVQGFMFAPNPDLVIGEDPVTPIEWLATGGDAEVVAHLVAGLPAAT
jgi:hypothetical protein